MSHLEYTMLQGMYLIVAVSFLCLLCLLLMSVMLGIPSATVYSTMSSKRGLIMVGGGNAHFTGCYSSSLTSLILGCRS